MMLLRSSSRGGTEFVDDALAEFFEGWNQYLRLKRDYDGNVVVWVEDVKAAKLTAV